MFETDKIIKLFNSELVVANVGPSSFAKAIGDQGYKTVQVDWAPPTEEDELIQKLLKIMGGV